MTRRIVITGMGAVSAFGEGVDPLWNGMLEGRSSIAALVSPDPQSEIRMKVGAAFAAFDPAKHFAASRLATLDRVSQFALVAAREAVGQAGIDIRGTGIGAKTAVIIGTGIGGELTRDEQSRRIYRDGAERVHPMSIIRSMPSAPASQISMEFGATGPTFVVSSACASSNHAIIQAILMLRHGLVDRAIVGGSEACFSLSSIRAWEAMRVVADDTCRPFCAQRRGLVLGEGSAAFVMEDREHALSRGAEILAELSGFGMTADAGDIVAPSAEGAAAAMRLALQDAGLATERIDYINAHGTGTLANDVTETRAIRSVFAQRAQRVAISSTKGVHGHALGAAGALELVAAVNAMRKQMVPPTANFIDADPECDLDYTPNVGRQKSIEAVLSNSFAFGGLNAVLALTRGH